MAKMNWERVKAENLIARHTDYSARMDEADARAELEAIFDAMRFAEQQRRSNKPPTVAKLSPLQRKPRQLPPLGSIERRQLEADAAQLGTTPAALLRRRWVNQQSGSSAAPPTDKRPATGAPFSKRTRDQEAANRLGISVEELKRRRREECARDLELHNQAAALGVTVKELRRRIAGTSPPA